MPSRRGIYFACDNNPRTLDQLANCLQSIRASGCNLPVHAVLVGDVPAQTVEALASRSANVIRRRWQDYPRFVRGQPTFLKWVALQEGFEHQELLFLDTDTFALRNPCELFDALGPEDFHARGSYQAVETDEPIIWGRRLICPPGSRPAYLRRHQALRERLGGEPVFGFNTGIMLFRNGSHRRLEKNQAVIRSLRRMFWTGILPYPMPASCYLMDEEVGRLTLGLLGGFSAQAIPAPLCPNYIESYQSLRAGPAILTHTFAMFYPHFLLTQIGPAACERYLAIPEQSSRLAGARMALQWAWIFLFHSSGLPRIGASWKSARARAALRRLIRSDR